MYMEIIVLKDTRIYQNNYIVVKNKCTQNSLNIGTAVQS